MLILVAMRFEEQTILDLCYPSIKIGPNFSQVGSSLTFAFERSYYLAFIPPRVSFTFPTLLEVPFPLETCCERRRWISSMGPSRTLLPLLIWLADFQAMSNGPRAYDFCWKNKDLVSVMYPSLGSTSRPSMSQEGPRCLVA